MLRGDKRSNSANGACDRQPRHATHGIRPVIAAGRRRTFFIIPCYACMVVICVYGFSMNEAHDAPPLAPNLDDVLDDAERMLGAMASRALPAVAEVAGILASQARGAGVVDIAEAA